MSNIPKIVFTHAYFIAEDEKEKDIVRPYAPLGILYISSYLEQNGFDNTVIDTTFINFDAFKSKIKAEPPDLLFIYTNLMTKINVIKMIDFIRNENSLTHVKIILGGPEVRHHAKNFLNVGADIIVFGEGEETCLDLVKSYSNKNEFDFSIPGIAFLSSANEFVQNPERALIRDINTLPFPNRNKIDLHKYLAIWKEKHGYNMLSLSTMRGCPYTCKWCSRAVYGGTYRRRKPSLVVEEMLLIKQKYNPDIIWFVDDVFTISHKWLSEFAAEVKKSNIIIPYEIITRADRMNDEVIALLRQSGCKRVWIGAESGSQKIIDAMDRRVDVSNVAEMIIKSNAQGIEAGTFIMLGYPGETKSDIKETIKHLKKSNPHFFTLTVAYPIKGTRLYEEVEENLYNVGDFKTTTDRDLDFKRMYPKKYYEYAVRYVNNEVYAHKEKSFIKKINRKAKSWLAQILMEFSKN